MREATGNLWTYPADYRVITTNGCVRRDGACVMGRGCAREAARRWPDLPYVVGTLVQRKGNRVHFLAEYNLFTFPVKHHWQDAADLALIAESTAALALQLMSTATYVMPRPGCGNGQRQWDDVRPLLLDLPDNVVVIDFGGVHASA